MPGCRRKRERSNTINKQTVFASLVCGLGATAFNNLCEALNLQRLHPSAFHKKQMNFRVNWRRSLWKSSAACVRGVFKTEQHQSDRRHCAGHNSELWSFFANTGHSAHIGIGCVVDVLTGLCIDAYVLCTYCQACHTAHQSLSSKPAENAAWVIQHVDECDKNFNGK